MALNWRRSQALSLSFQSSSDSCPSTQERHSSSLSCLPGSQSKLQKTVIRVHCTTSRQWSWHALRPEVMLGHQKLPQKRSREQVFERAEAVEEAERTLERLLPELRRRCCACRL